MQRYLSGKITILAGVAAFVAWMELRDNFYLSNPLIFWGAQFVFVVAIVIMLFLALKDWREQPLVSKKRLLLSILNIPLLYILAWTQWDIAWILILILCILDADTLRKYMDQMK